MERSPAIQTPSDPLEPTFSIPDGTLEMASLVALVGLTLAVGVLKLFVGVILLSAALVTVLIIINQSQDKSKRPKYEFSADQTYSVFFALGIILYSWMFLLLAGVSITFDFFLVFRDTGGIISILFYLALAMAMSFSYFLIGLYLAEKFLHLATKPKNREEWEYILSSPLDGYKIILQALVTIYMTTAALVASVWWIVPPNLRDYVLSKTSYSTRTVIAINNGNYWFVFPIFRLGIFLLLTAMSTMIIITYKFENYEKKNLELLVSRDGFYGIPLVAMLFIIGGSGILVLYIAIPQVVLGLAVLFSIIMGLILHSKNQLAKKPKRHTCGRPIGLSEKNCPYCVRDTRLAQYHIASDSLSLLTCPICGEQKETVSRSCKNCNGLIVTRCPVCQWVISPIWNQCIHCGSRVTPIPKIALSPRERPFANKTLIIFLGPLLFLIPTYILILFSFVTVKFNPFNILFFAGYDQLVDQGAYRGLLDSSSSSGDILLILNKTAIITTLLIISSIAAIVIIFTGKSYHSEWLQIFSISLLASLLSPTISVFTSWAIIVIISLPIIVLLIISAILGLIAYAKLKPAIFLLDTFQTNLTFLHLDEKSEEAQKVSAKMQANNSSQAVKSWQ